MATDKYVVTPEHVPAGIADDAVHVILSDHHYWGGLRASRESARICDILGIGQSMHSNLHLGIGLAAMAHLAAATPNLTYDCDTRYPWQRDDVIQGGELKIKGGMVAVPDGPGLGVFLDRAELRRLHKNFVDYGIKARDDESEMQKHWPDWEFGRPKF